MPESAIYAPYTTAYGLILSLDIWRSLRSRGTCSILRSLQSFQAIKGKITRQAEANGKVTIDSFNFSQYFGMKRWFSDTLQPIFIAYPFPIVIFRFTFSPLKFCNHQGWFAPEIWLTNCFIISAYIFCPWLELQARGVINDCLKLFQIAFGSVSIATGNTSSSLQTLRCTRVSLIAPKLLAARSACRQMVS